jgi:hydrogenase nickel incorporation protein HypB
MCEECGCGSHDEQQKETREIRIEENVLAKNDTIASEIRSSLSARGAVMVNILSSPGAGKTRLLEESLPLLDDVSVAIIEGDVQTRYDAERLRKKGLTARQVNTGGACHLDAASVARVLQTEPFDTADIIIIENVGNLVCPAAFDLGENAKVVALSVTEGEDKPEKYPAAFAAASLMIVTKMDLAEHTHFDLDRCVEGAWQVHPGLKMLKTSAETGEGLEEWLNWLRHLLSHARGEHHHH